MTWYTRELVVPLLYEQETLSRFSNEKETESDAYFWLELGSHWKNSFVFWSLNQETTHQNQREQTSCENFLTQS